MTTFYLIRHGANDWLPKGLAGRATGTNLNKEGVAQSEALAAHLVTAGIQKIFSSPLERAVQTATPLATTLGLQIQVEDSLIEINFGDWTGKTWEELRSMQDWKTFNQFRSGMRIPNGELMIEAQHRVIHFIDQIHKQHFGKTVAFVSHGDVIRSALAFYMGMPIDFFQRFEIAPASYSIVQLSREMPQVLCINRLAPLI